MSTQDKNWALTEHVTLREKSPYSELFWSAFSRIRTEYGEILPISPYSVQMRENADQNNSEYDHFLRSVNQTITLLVNREVFEKKSVSLLSVIGSCWCYSRIWTLNSNSLIRLDSNIFSLSL